MTESPVKNAPPKEVEQGRNLLQTVLLALVSTLILIPLLEFGQGIGWMEVVVAVATGVAAGVVMAVNLVQFQFESMNEGLLTVAAILLVAGTMVLGAILPQAFIQLVPHFGIAFVWSLSLGSVTRQLI